MLEQRTVYINGDYFPWKDANVHLMCHSFGRGSAIFEVISLYRTGKGPSVFRLDGHINRFFTSAELLGMEVPMTRGEMTSAVKETVRKNDIEQGMIKIIGYYSQIAFEILPPAKKIDISIFVLDPAEDIGGMAFPFEKGTTLAISKWRKLDPETVPVEVKAAANYLNGMVARSEAREKGFDNAVMLDTQGFIAEGGTESIFLVHQNRLLTPALGTVLRSITRQSVLEASAVIGIEAEERRIKPDLLFEADEVFLSSTPFKVLPVRQIDNHRLENIPGPVSRELLSLFKDILNGQDERFERWLFPVEPDV
jgi:branched-chain amino acid aminotransferase